MAGMEERREIWYISDSDQIVRGIHPVRWCSGVCVVHRPSNHFMREFPLAFDLESKCFYRTCSHGEVHQDPDERTYWTRMMELTRKKRREKTVLVALEKLSSWGCPYCSCGCCDVTKLASM